jgi:hypothetical protein
MDSTFDCQHCGKSSTQETAFERWIRNNERLDKPPCIARFDLDVLLHRYKFDGSRDVQAMMFIEVKTHQAKIKRPQAATLNIFHQVLRHRDGEAVFCTMEQRDVQILMFGGHLLRLSHSSPVDSEWMEWGGVRIDESQLEKLLKFELCPDNPTQSLDVLACAGA